MSKKYELTNEMIKVNGVVLHRIKALGDFSDVKAGDLGGWVESDDNLSHNGNAWVSGDARVSGNAEVYGDAWVSGNAWVFGDARVSGNAWVSENARVSGNAEVFGNAWVFGDAHILIVGPIGSRNDYTTFCRAKDNVITVTCGCFHGSIYAFEAQVKTVHGDNKYCKEYMLAIELAKCHIDLS